MKTDPIHRALASASIPVLLAAALLAGVNVLAADPSSGTNAPAEPTPPAAIPAQPALAPEQVAPVTPPAAPAAEPVPEPAPDKEMPPAEMVPGNDGSAPVPESEPMEDANHDQDALRLNFRGVPLEMVLNYLSEAAGFIIVLDAQPRGRIDAWSNQPLTRDEAVALLNSVLQKNGLAAIRKGRTLTVVNRDEAKIKAVPVRTGNDPAAIPDNDEIVTQIIPVRYVEAAQLLKDLQPLVSMQTAMTANESGNSIVITDTQANIRRVAEIIKAIDAGAEDVTEVRVFRLQNADPTEMSELLASLFPEDNSRSSNQGGGGFRSFFRGGGFGGPPGGGGGNSSSGAQNQRIRKRARVVAVPDNRTASVVVTAARDLMDQIQEVVTELDENPAKRQTVKVFQLQNADPQEAAAVLQDIFQKNGTQNRNSRNNTSLLQNRSEQQQQQNNQTMGRNNRSTTRRTSR